MPAQKKQAVSKAVKKQVKAIAKKTARQTAAPKAVRKQVSAIAKKLAKNTKTNQRDRQAINAEMERLKKEMANLKGKKSKKQLSEYNLFIRRQILDGKTFNQAIALWNKLRRWEEGKIPTKTRIRTVIKRVSSKPRVIVKTKTRTRRVLVPGKSKIVVRRIKSKPTVVTKYRTRTKKVFVPGKIRTRFKTRTVFKTKRVKSKPQIQYKTRFVDRPVEKIVEKIIRVPALTAPLEEMDDSRMETVSTVNKALSATLSQQLGRDLALEELAYRMVKVYFEELARTGFKRQMSLDDLIDAFVYSWYRVEKQLGKKQQIVHHEENAYRIMHLYYIELARLGQKRTLSLDEMLDSYFYTLTRLGKDNTQLISQMEAVRLQQQFASQTTTMVTEKKTELNPVETTTTTTTVMNNPQ